jgi:flavodoxin
MKIVIFYQSFHHKNTEKVVNAIVPILHCEAIPLSEAKSEMLSRYDVIGFASGVYFAKPHIGFEKLLAGNNNKGKKCFIIATSGAPEAFYNKFHGNFRKTFNDVGFEIIDFFDCPGFDTYPAISKPFGGFAKGHPNEKDFEAARIWAKNLINKMQGQNTPVLERPNYRLQVREQ